MPSQHVKPELIRWARERAGFEPAQLSRRFPSLARWERGERRPTLKSVERFARAMHVPVDRLFLARPPVERLPIPDLRSAGNERRRRLSPDLIEIVDVCRGRQAWYREFVRGLGAGLPPPLAGAGGAGAIETGASIREALGRSFESQRKAPAWIDALRRLTEKIESLGILVMSSSVVLNDNRRRLRPEEFRGFTLADSLAPLLFVNAAQTKAEQMFVLAHQLAHAWVGQSGVCDARVAVASEGKELWCDQVAGEILVPLEAFRGELKAGAELRDEVLRLTRRFKVSPAVVLRRLHDAGGLSAEDLEREVQADVDRERARPKGKGGNFYLSLGVRVSKRFARALVASAAPADALRLLGLRKAETLRGFAQRLGVGE